MLGILGRAQCRASGAARTRRTRQARGDFACGVLTARSRRLDIHHRPAIRFERAIHDLFGHEPIGSRDRRPWLDHGAWGLRAPLGAREPAPLRDPVQYEFLPVEGHGLHEIPVGPVHAGIIEPGHFRFTANGEIVARLEERLGYVHKGIDGLLVDAELARAARVIARVSGDSTVAYSLAFAHAVEAALGISAPPRAVILRGVMAELERIANHFGDIGAICNDASFTLIHAYCGIFRENMLQASDHAFGHRLMMDCIVPGGLANDITADGASAILKALDDTAPRFAEIVTLYDETPSLQDRTCTTGIVGNDLVTQWAAGGFVGRGSGRSFDARRDLAYAPYGGAEFDVPVMQAGDVDARVWVRIREVEQSVKLIRNWLAALPSGSTRVVPCRAKHRYPRRHRGGGSVSRRRAGVGPGPGRPSPARACARRVLPAMAAAGGGDRRQHRGRLPALQ